MRGRNIAMGGKYYKNRRTKERRSRRPLIIATMLISLVIFSLGAIYSIDYTIRKNMLPSAPAILELRYSAQEGYSLEVMGTTYSLAWINALSDSIDYAINSPTSLERLFFLGKAMVTGEQPQTYISEDENQLKFA